MLLKHASRREVFGKKSEIPERTENWPASGITFEQASEYCKWLSEKTVRRHRLPKESEIGAAAIGNDSNENNLD